MEKIKVRLKRSMIGSLRTHRKVVRSLGLSRINQVKELPDVPEVRGQIKKVEYMVEIVE
jgi:large subunit ribosomal protein L30